MEGQANPLRRFNFNTRVLVFLAYGLTRLALSNAQFTACTTRGNHTDDVYREVPIKNARTSVTLSSPNFPKSYPQNIQCTWRILAPVGYHVKLSFLEFDLEESYQGSGCHDHVSIRDGGLVFREAKEIRKRCGKSKPPSVSSSNAVMWIRFIADNKVEKRGFSIKVLPVRGSTSKRYIFIGVLVSLLLIIIIAIIVCRKRFKRNDTEAPKARQYQELPVPVDVEPEQRDTSLRALEMPENDWSNERKKKAMESSANFFVPPLRNSEASKYCFLLEEGDTFEFKANRPFNKATPKKPLTNEHEDLEYTELLTVV